MPAWQVSAIVFGCIVGGVLVGILLREMLPKSHLDADSKDVVKLGMGLVATMSALVLGLLVASAKGSYDTQRTEVTQLAANVVLLDRILAHYGPDAADVRDHLRRATAALIERIWPTGDSKSAQLDPTSQGADVVYDDIQRLQPQSEAQRTLKAQALGIFVDIGRTRWLMFEQSGSAIPKPFLIVLIFWLAILFTSFSLFAPQNLTVVFALCVSALSVSGALFLILELDQPFGGIIRVSNAPLRSALAHLGQ